jgi:prepilin signal peptidase PulO-like enzyme (type II secretory pathway)
MIAWHDNIPVFSFIMLKGKCRYCHKSISWQYPAVEVITGLLFVIAWVSELRIMNYELWFYPDFVIHNSLFIIHIFRDWFLISVMMIIFIYDLRWYLILDIVTLPAAAILLALNLMLGHSWQTLLFSAIIGSSFFLIQFVISKGRWIGGGDIRLGFLIGLALGWPNTLVAIFLAYFIGSIAGLGLIASKRKKWGSEIPLGVFLSLGTIITLFWGDRILNWYLNIFKF